MGLQRRRRQAPAVLAGRLPRGHVPGAGLRRRRGEAARDIPPPLPHQQLRRLRRQAPVRSVGEGGRRRQRWRRSQPHHRRRLLQLHARQVLLNHVKTVLTRVNTVTGVAYKDDTAILGWELMNEPRCSAEPTGALVQAWVEEMSPYLKTIDANHLVTPGLEGFYGDGAHESKELNPWSIYYGTNFIATHRAPGIDFATIHLYPDVWLWGTTADEQAAFFRNWTASHVRDTEMHLGMPLLVTEYGKFLWEDQEGGENATARRDLFLGTVLDAIYASASRGKPLVGGAFWQLLLDGDDMDALKDGYQIVLPDDELAASIISEHSEKMAELSEQDALGEARGHRRRSEPRKIGGFGSSRSSTGPYVQTFLVRFGSLFSSVSSLLGAV